MAPDLEKRAREKAEELTSKYCMGKFSLSEASDSLAEELISFAQSEVEAERKRCADIARAYDVGGPISDLILSPTPEPRR